MKVWQVRVLFPLILSFSLLGCGTADNGGPTAGQAFFKQMQQRISNLGAEPAPPLTFTRASFANVKGAILLVHIPSRDAVASLVLVRESQGHKIWLTADGVSLTTRDGVLTATRGLGYDVMSAQVAPVLRAMAQGPANYTRQQWYLNGQDQMQTRQLTCTMQSQGQERIVILDHPKTTQHFVETCKAGNTTITNQYWRGGNGTLWKSQQWLGPEVGEVTLEIIQ